MFFDRLRRWYEQWRRPAHSGRVDPADSIIPTLTVVSTLEAHREHMPHPTPPHHHNDVTHTHSDSGGHAGHSDGGGGHSDGGGAASH